MTPYAYAVQFHNNVQFFQCLLIVRSCFTHNNKCDKHIYAPIEHLFPLTLNLMIVCVVCFGLETIGGIFISFCLSYSSAFWSYLTYDMFLLCFSARWNYPFDRFLTYQNTIFNIICCYCFPFTTVVNMG